MAIGEAPGGTAQPAWDRVEQGARCGFCLQAVDDPVRTSCFRCHALYHADCWDANGARCAVYACDPAAWVPARRLRTRPRLRPPELPSQARSLQSSLLGGLFLLAISAFVTFGLRSAQERSLRNLEDRSVPTVGPRGAVDASRSFLDVTRETRGFFYELDRAGHLPADDRSRARLLSTAVPLAGKLRTALDAYERNDVEGLRAIELRREWSQSLRRLERLIRELEGADR